MSYDEHRESHVSFKAILAFSFPVFLCLFMFKYETLMINFLDFNQLCKEAAKE